MSEGGNNGDGGNDGKDGNGGNGKANDANETVSISKSELDNLTKARDEERRLRKEAEGKLTGYEKSAEDKKAEEERKKAEEKGEYEKILSQKDEEIQKYKPHSERLEKLLKDAEERNKKDLELFTDEEDKKLVESAINGKDALDARELIKGFKTKFLGNKEDKNNVGNGVKANPADHQVKLDKISTLQKEFEALADKRRKGEMFNSAEKKRLVEIPNEIKALKGETEKETKEDKK